MTSYGDIDLCQHFLGKGMLFDGSKPLHEPMMTSVRSTDIHLSVISQEILQPSIFNSSLKISNLELYSNLPGAPFTNMV